MGQLGELLQNIPCAFLMDNRLMVPLWQMMLYTVIISFCLLLKRYRLGLSVSFIFCFYWGFIANREVFLGRGNIDRFSLPFILYMAGGFIMVVLSVASFFASED